MGRAKVDELHTVFGRPLEITDLESVGDTRHSLYHYASKSDLPGRFVATIDKRTKTVVNVELKPDVDLTKVKAIAYFGGKCTLTRYTLKDCEGGAFDSGSLFEDSEGETEFIEFRDKGIAILLTEGDHVHYISYVSGPVGKDPRFKCK